jgi:RNA polymerase sigma-70 factor (ECF subfamily)
MPDGLSDAELMLAVKSGEPEAMEVLLRRHRRHVHGYLYRMVQNTAVAEELAQETFLRLYKARFRYVATAKFTSWLYRISTNLALNWIRDHQLEASAGSLEEVHFTPAARRWLSVTRTPESLLLREERLACVRRAVAALPERQRSAILLHKYGELEYTEIAEALDTTTSAVRSLMNRAFVTLRVRLAAEGFARA